MSDFITYLYRRLRHPLPGFEAQEKMIPKTVDFSNHRPIAPSNAIPCSVLLILKKNKTKFDILLTLRSSFLKNHQNQISFPGGKLEQGETDILGALRETQEEIGLIDSHFEIVGKLSPLYMVHTNMNIQPIVAELKTDIQQVSYSLSDEVEEVLWVNLNQLADFDSIQYESKEIRKRIVTYPFWDVHENVPLWGATAMILSELITLFEEFNQNGSQNFS